MGFVIGGTLDMDPSNAHNSDALSEFKCDSLGIGSRRGRHWKKGIGEIGLRPCKS